MGFVEGLRIMSKLNRFPLKSSVHALLLYCQSDFGKRHLDLLSSYFTFQMESDHLAINAGISSVDRLKESLGPSSGDGSTKKRARDEDDDSRSSSPARSTCKHNLVSSLNKTSADCLVNLLTTIFTFFDSRCVASFSLDLF